jgi:hypothetical protein
VNTIHTTPSATCKKRRATYYLRPGKMMGEGKTANGQTKVVFSYSNFDDRKNGVWLS